MPRIDVQVARSCYQALLTEPRIHLPRRQHKHQSHKPQHPHTKATEIYPIVKELETQSSSESVPAVWTPA
jgi:hypothetical protein